MTLCLSRDFWPNIDPAIGAILGQKSRDKHSVIDCSVVLGGPGHERYEIGAGRSALKYRPDTDTEYDLRVGLLIVGPAHVPPLPVHYRQIARQSQHAAVGREQRRTDIIAL